MVAPVPRVVVVPMNMEVVAVVGYVIFMSIKVVEAAGVVESSKAGRVVSSAMFGFNF
jgi:hypothetical protein